MTENTRRNYDNIGQLLNLHSRLDLIFDVDLINDFIDVRSSVVFDINSNNVIIAQSDPPILKSMIGRSFEATFIRRDPVTGEIIRWGWRCQVKEVISNYRLRPDDPNTVQAVAVSAPLSGGLTETNARMDYRLSISSEKRISIQTHPSFGHVSLLDFSAGGVLVGIPRPPQAKVGMRLWFTLFFPIQSSPGQQTTINGEAEVVRVTHDAAEQFARVGLKFLDLDLSATRALQKAINFYMMEEQRSRNRNMPTGDGMPPMGGGGMPPMGGGMPPAGGGAGAAG